MHNQLRHTVAASVACLCGLVAAVSAVQAVAGENRWTAIGPDGANVVVLAIEPVTPSTVFAGTMGSGVLKSIDGGASWAIANRGLSTANILTLAIDSSMPSTLYVGTDAGVFKSTDGAQSWVAANSGLVGASQITVNALAIAPDSTSTIYAATSAGVFKTIDGAANWTSINAGLSGLTPRAIAVDPASSSTIYVGVDDNVNYTGNGVFKSTDAGATWVEIFYTLPKCGFMCDGAPSVDALAIDPHSPSRLYVTVGGGLVGSLDGGASWFDVNVPQADFLSLAIDPASPATLYAGTYSGAVFRTTDAGARWTPVTASPLAATSINVIAMAASAPGTIYAGSRSAIFQSSDGAQTWRHLTLGVRNVVVYGVAVDPTAPSTIYAGVDGVIEKTTDGGVHWADSSLGISGRLSGPLVTDPVLPATLYAAVGSASGTYLYKSTDSGAHWNSMLALGVQTLAVAPSRPSTLYAGQWSAGVLKSTDGGASWTLVNTVTVFANPYPFSALAVDPMDADVVYVATPPTGHPDTDAMILKSTDGAAQWRQLPIVVPKGARITFLAIDPVRSSTIYAAYGNLNRGGVFKSTDSGETWIASQDGLPAAWVQSLAIDPASPSRVYAATGTGVFRSTDAATSWTPINAGLPNLDVWSLSIDRTGSLLRAATSAGLFEYQIGPPGTVGPGFTGTWYDPAQSGHGILVQILSDQRFYVTWFAFNPAGTQQAWFTGVGTYSGNTATITAVEMPTGGRWIPNFDPSQIARNAWGTLTLTFTDCDHGKVDFDSVLGYGAGSMNLTRLTQPAGLTCP